MRAAAPAKAPSRASTRPAPAISTPGGRLVTVGTAAEGEAAPGGGGGTWVAGASLLAGGGGGGSGVSHSGAGVGTGTGATTPGGQRDEVMVGRACMVATSVQR